MGKASLPIDLATARRIRAVRQRDGLSWDLLATRFGYSVTTLRTAVERLEAAEAGRAEIAQAEPRRLTSRAAA